MEREQAMETVNSASFKEKYKGMMFAIVESKLTEKARKTWFGVRCMGESEATREGWIRQSDGSFSRIAEVVLI